MDSIFDKNSDVLDKQLRAQVDILWPREVECLENHGLREAQTVLDIGTGNGYFLCRLAERYPDKKFLGIDSSAPLIKKAQEIISVSGLSNIEVRVESCPAIDITENFDFILARLSLYCIPNREDVLKWAYSRLKKGGKIAVIDVDDGLCYAYPENSVWLSIFEALVNKLGTMGADLLIGRKLPQLLLKTGFRCIQYNLKSWYSSIDLESSAFVEYWKGDAKTVHSLVPEIFTKKHLEEFEKFLEYVAKTKDQTAMYFMCVASGSK